MILYLICFVLPATSISRRASLSQRLADLHLRKILSEFIDFQASLQLSVFTKNIVDLSEVCLLQEIGCRETLQKSTISKTESSTK